MRLPGFSSTPPAQPEAAAPVVQAAAPVVQADDPGIAKVKKRTRMDARMARARSRGRASHIIAPREDELGAANVTRPGARAAKLGASAA